MTKVLANATIAIIAIHKCIKQTHFTPYIYSVIYLNKNLKSRQKSTTNPRRSRAWDLTGLRKMETTP